MGLSLVVAIIPKDSAENLVTDEVSDLCVHIVSVQARGTVVREKWTDRFLPFIHPEEMVYQFIVESSNEDALIKVLIKNGRFEWSNAGSLMVFPCDYVSSSNGVITNASEIVYTDKLKSDLTMIVAIVQKDKADALAAYSMSLGITGPTVIFGNGKGIRDRMGLVRVAINPEKEIMSMILPKEESCVIFEKLCMKGGFHLAGEGLIYELPVKAGILNSPSVITEGVQSVSMSQIIQAIDDLKGHSNWRRSSVELKRSSKGGNLAYLENLTRLTCFIPEAISDNVVMAAIHAGAPAASLCHGDCVKSAVKKNVRDDTISLGNPQDIIEFILSEEMVETILEAIHQEVQANSVSDYLVMTHSIPKAFTYLE